MKLKFLIFLIVILEFNNQSSTNTYDYSSYSAVSTNTDLTGETLSSTTADQSVVYITESGKTITNSNLNKDSGDSSKTENSEFFGVNAAVLVQGGGVTINGGTITTKAKGANALCATNNGKVTISGTKITSTAGSSGRGLHATYGGEISASNVEISSTGGSCATLATDRGEGTVTCNECTLSTGGSGSPLIYSTGTITVTKTTGTATKAQAVVVEGKNSASVTDSSNLNCYGLPNAENDIDISGVMLYQSMSGDAGTGTSIFNCQSSTISIDSASRVYGTAPMFFITNTDAEINLESCTFTYGSSKFLSAGGTSRWGTSGSNGGVVTLNLKNQSIKGDFVIDGSSGLTINLENSSIEGTINTNKTGAKVAITLDDKSTITLTGNSFYTSLTNSKTDGSNIIKGSYTFEQYTEKEISRASSGTGGGEGGSGDKPPEPPDGKSSDGQGAKPSGEPPEPPDGKSSDGPGAKPSGDNSDQVSGKTNETQNSYEEDGAENLNHFFIVTLSLIIVLLF